ncbi:MULTISPECIES: hypothetical protein [Salinibaculum]|uniref:hypothetical protein n=1 Tax=Salinibaculum TaxID=2732368 RepID=UPI0030CBF7EC
MAGADTSGGVSADTEEPGAVMDALDEDELTATFTEDLWLDRLARKLGFGRLSEWLPGETPPSYLYALVLIGTIVPVLNGRAYLVGDPVVYLQNPFFVLQPIALLGAVYGSRALRRRYHQVTREMNIADRTRDPDKLIDIVPDWLPWAFFVSAVLLNYVRVLALGGPVAIYQDKGLSAVIGWMVVNPIWASIAAQFFAVYLSVELIAPWRLWRSDIGIDFRDPEGLGGLRPLGELIKHAYYYMVAGLIAFALVTYGPVLSVAEWGPTATTNVIFTTAWVATVATVAYGVFTLHRFMRREKRRELHRLKQVEQKYTDDPWDITAYTVSQDDQEMVDEIRQRMERVSATNEYPATFSIWSQLLVSIVLPKAAQLLIASV